MINKCYVTVPFLLPGCDAQIWDYHCLGNSLDGIKADFVFALGSHDLRVAERAADLYLAGHAPYLLLSGGLGNFTEASATSFPLLSRQQLRGHVMPLPIALCIDYCR